MEYSRAFRRQANIRAYEGCGAGTYLVHTWVFYLRLLFRSLAASSIRGESMAESRGHQRSRYTTFTTVGMFVSCAYSREESLRDASRWTWYYLHRRPFFVSHRHGLTKCGAESACCGQGWLFRPSRAAAETCGSSGHLSCLHALLSLQALSDVNPSCLALSQSFAQLFAFEILGSQEVTHVQATTSSSSSSSSSSSCGDVVSWNVHANQNTPHSPQGVPRTRHPAG